MSERKPNSHECACNGREPPNLIADLECSSTYSTYLCIGRGDDGRAKLFIESDDTKAGLFAENIDLEDILRFAAKYCRGIYDRVGREVEAYEQKD